MSNGSSNVQFRDWAESGPAADVKVSYFDSSHGCLKTLLYSSYFSSLKGNGGTDKVLVSLLY